MSKDRAQCDNKKTGKPGVSETSAKNFQDRFSYEFQHCFYATHTRYENNYVRLARALEVNYLLPVPSQ